MLFTEPYFGLVELPEADEALAKHLTSMRSRNSSQAPTTPMNASQLPGLPVSNEVMAE
jgi:hypothetical protein